MLDKHFVLGDKSYITYSKGHVLFIRLIYSKHAV